MFHYQRLELWSLFSSCIRQHHGDGGKFERRGMLLIGLIVIYVDHCKEIDFIKSNLSTTVL